jgi:hypothetical protein
MDNQSIFEEIKDLKIKMEEIEKYIKDMINEKVKN